MRLLLKSEDDRQKLIRKIESLDLSDKRYVAEVKQFRPVRNLSQNNLMWMWFRCIGDELGYTADEIHDLMVAMFLGSTEKVVLGMVIYDRQGTSDLDTKEFSEFLDNVNRKAIDMNIYLPLPGGDGWDEFYERYGR